MQFWFDAVEFGFEQSCRKAFRPFVKIARDHAVRRRRTLHQFGTQKSVNLQPAFEKRSAEMDVHKLHHSVTSNRDVRTKTSARLVFFDRDVKVAMFLDRQPT